MIKHIKVYIRIYFFLFVLAVSVRLFATPYERHILEIVDRSYVRLNDNSLWQVINSNEEVEHWSPGDSIALDIPFLLFTTEYRLTNLKLNRLVCAKLIEASRQEQIEKISLDGRLLRLSDQSIWWIDYFESWTSENWENEHQIVIMPASNSSGYYLFNLDCSDENPCVYAHYSFKQDESLYRHFIADIFRDEKNSYLKLENGFTWKIEKNLFSNAWRIVDNWQTGDEVNCYCECFENSGRRVYITLINLRLLQTVSVKYDQQSKEWKSQTIIQMEERTPYAILITLDDGSLWKIEDPLYEADDWKIGDRLLLCANLYARSHNEEPVYCIFNSDRGLRSFYWNFLYSVGKGKLIQN